MSLNEIPPWLRFTKNTAKTQVPEDQRVADSHLSGQPGGLRRRCTNVVESPHAAILEMVNNRSTHLPKYSPDWNPDEKVWNHLKHQELKGHQAKTKNELKILTQKKLNEMSHDRELLQGIFFRCCVAELLE